ncbi:hypothetical protein ABIF93_005797 [Bradyrhizobium japonicum]
MSRLNTGMAALGGLLGVLMAWSASPVVTIVVPLLFAFIGGAGGLSLMKMDLSKPASILKLKTVGNAFIFCCGACLAGLLIAMLARPILADFETGRSSRYKIEGKNLSSNDYINQIALRRRLELVKASDDEIKAILSGSATLDGESMLTPLTQAANDFKAALDGLSEADRKTFLAMEKKNRYDASTILSLSWATSVYLTKIDAHVRAKNKLTPPYFSYLTSSYEPIKLNSFNFHFEQESDVAFIKQHGNLIDTMTKLLIVIDKLNESNTREDRNYRKSLDDLIQASAAIKEAPQQRLIAGGGRTSF